LPGGVFVNVVEATFLLAAAEKLRDMMLRLIKCPGSSLAGSFVVASCCCLLAVLSPQEVSAAAVERGPVQLLTGRVDADEVVLYRVPDMQQGQQLMIRVEATSGNLDPAFGVISAVVDSKQLEALYEEADEIAVERGGDPIAAMESLRQKYFLAFDDDGGGGLTAALQFDIPADGEYAILVAGAQKALSRGTFGNYRLLIGLNRSDVLDGSAQPGGDSIASLNLEATPPGVGVEEAGGTLGGGKVSSLVALQPLKQGDTLYAWLEATKGELTPALLLKNFAGKPIRSSNLDGTSTRASLQYTFPADAENYQLQITACCADGEIAGGRYHLLVGINEPAVMSGSAELDGRPVIRRPIEVRTGLRLEQIIEVNQPRELFSAVATLRMEWWDPALAFNPESCQCDSRTLYDMSLDQYIAAAQGRWPAFFFRNQQGKRWSQNRIATILADGSVTYSERFTTNFQEDFDFRQFPFDTQAFLIHLDAAQPEEHFVFRRLAGFSDISADHGEDEFILTSFDTRLYSTEGSAGDRFSGFTFQFEAPRHLSYYVFRIFVPISLLILVSWFTFFLGDYKHRIEVTSANLLVFIAFSFSIAGNYPRLGYLTFLDAIMAVMFVMSALVVMYNVAMKRMEQADPRAFVNRIDNFMDWCYPLFFVAALGILVLFFF
jgi:hypothetical protein